MLFVTDANSIGLQQVPPNQQVNSNPRMVMATGGPAPQGLMAGAGGPGQVMMPGAPSGPVILTSSGQPGQPSMMSAQPGSQMMQAANPNQGMIPGAAGPGILHFNFRIILKFTKHVTFSHDIDSD